ncbi:Protein of unknown function precursor [Flavobacterium indicum GPTSA100-9 = DSM 17447]|uniref:DUF4177 domain-containing protein n=1 Tax=Flavobacterium indicum (strain DSM 17447 / CIP 109464 / GPTSA100-9) TaxID=1094466 RepID=H8XSB3_FLAIG|nr:hypothetical protein [Flavobacterium indicum]CCG52498.1 Protein of unknown function precursor [Flavobacterium indicum GPTSA100-9 = DSM 17447]
MKKFNFCLIFFLTISSAVFGQISEFKIVTTIESIVPGGAGRSRIIENGTEVDYTEFTTVRSKEGKDKTNKDRSDVKIDDLNETTLVNFYSMVGINFQNIASNDAMMTSLLNKYSKDGWDLIQITSAAESDAGKDDGNGIFITRYFFKRAVKE